MYNDFREYSAAFYVKQSDILHFGVKGMKWGVIRWKDKFSNMFQRFKRENSFGDKRDTSTDREMNALSVKNIGNKAIIDGARKVSNKYRDKSINLKKDGEIALANRANELASDIFSESKNYIEKSKQLKEMSYLYGHNCPKTTLALELKKRGINVNPKAKTHDIGMDKIREIYVNETTTKCNTNKDFFNSKNYGKPGDHGAIYGARKDGAHIFNYTVLKDGTVQLEDAQSGTVMSLKEAQESGRILSNYIRGEIINLTKAEIDMDEVRKHDMFVINQQDGSAMKLAQYERNVKKYIKNKKRAEKWMRNLAKGLDKIKKLFKRR